MEDIELDIEFMARFLPKLQREIEQQEHDQRVVRMNHFAYRGSKPEVYRSIYAQRVMLKQAIAQALGEAA